jgi:pimeloyl-ACP methyl ester carboxylesterase
VVHTGDASVVERYNAPVRNLPDSVANELTRITIPTLVIHGTADPLVPVDQGMAVARLIQGCQLPLIAVVRGTCSSLQTRR